MKRLILLHFLLITLLLTACYRVSVAKESGSLRINHSFWPAFEVALAYSEAEQLTAAWYTTQDELSAIVLRQISVEGIPLSDEMILSEEAQLAFEPSITQLSDVIAATWYTVTDGVYESSLSRLNIHGETLWSVSLGKNSRNPVVVSDENRLFSAWIGLDDQQAWRVYAGWWSWQGKPLSTVIDVGPASSTTWNLNADLTPTEALLVYDAALQDSAEELILAHVSQVSADWHQISPNDGFASKYPDIKVSENGTQTALTWFDNRFGQNEVFALIGPSKDFLSNITSHLELTAQRITSSRGDSIGAYMAWSGDTLGVVWCDNSSGVYDVFLQKFSSAGKPQGESISVSASSNHSMIPSILGLTGGFAIAWNERSLTPEDSTETPSSEIRYRFIPLE